MEADAKEAKLGLWKDHDPIPPWEFRHDRSRATRDLEPSHAPLASDYAIRGNKRSGKYHRPDCPNDKDIAPQNRMAFESVQAAENAGVEAGNCPH